MCHLAQANPSDGDEGSIHPLRDHDNADDEDANHGVAEADPNSIHQ